MSSSPTPTTIAVAINNHSQQQQPKSEYWAHIKGFTAGVCSGVAKLVVGHPFDTVKVRLQTEGYHGKFSGPIDCLVQTAKKEGLPGLYKGALVPLFGWSVMDSVLLGTVTYVRKFIKENMHREEPNYQLSILDHSIAGFFGGMACSFVANPIEQIKSRLQVQYNWDASTQRYKGPFDCMKQLWRNHGIVGFYTGMTGTLWFRSFCSIYIGSYEYFKLKLANWNSHSLPTSVINFVAGGSAATVMWICCFPADTVKNRIMSQPDVPKAELKYKGLLDCVKKIYFEEGGLKGFYRGFVPCLLRSFPTNGASFLAWELAMKWLP
ncbi:hypothetical protein C9374_011557 [Naegleria lovaniensis]|uniref:Mitochondrial carrier protein n=1 Tax=Naegleria lovaniensis TaxID=51637 RepID=A0AA88H4R2_NAELO|nr:uncharacterized protein C9374_011557 [Naegleria lovaniensis]KAG2392832.1 hypothetical protein C9374_011557 [Naegleria lovaniensis]